MLIPRSVVLHPSSDAIEVINVTSWTNNSIEFFFMNSVNITNNNYYPVDVINASVTVPIPIFVLKMCFRLLASRIPTMIGRTGRVAMFRRLFGATKRTTTSFLTIQ